MNQRILATKDGRFNRDLVIWTQEPSPQDSCTLCNRTDVPLIGSDGSDDEYTFALLCLECVTRALTN